MKITKQGVKNLICCIVFLAIAAFIFIHLTYVFRPKPRTGRAILIDYYNEDKNTVDVVVMGASGTYRYFNPMIAWDRAGMASHTYAVASMQASAYMTAIRDIERTQSPKLYIVDARRFSTYDTVTEIDASVQRYMNSIDVNLNRFAGIKYFCDLNDIPIKDSLPTYLDLVQYHDNYYALYSKWHWSHVLNRGKTVSNCFKGFLGSNHAERQEEFTGITTDEEAELPENILKVYTDFLDYCKKRDLPVVLVVTPSQFTDDSWRQYNTMERIAGEYGIPYLNLNTKDIYQDMGLDFERDFYNPHHMNVNGAEKYTAYLTDYILKNYDIPDHRGEEAYASWDEELERYDQYSIWTKQIIENRLLGIPIFTGLRDEMEFEIETETDADA